MSSKPKLTHIRVELLIAIAALVWLRYEAPRRVQDTAGYTVFTASVCVLSFYCVKALGERLHHRHPLPGTLRTARAKSPVSFYAGIIGVGVGFVLNVFFILSLATSPQGSQFWWGVAFGSVGLGFFYSWLGAYQLRVSANRIEYWSFFGGYRSLTLDEIQHARIRIGWFTYWDRYRPTFRLEVLARDDERTKPIIVNLKVFREEELQQIFDWFGTKLDGPDKLEFSRVRRP